MSTNVELLVWRASLADAPAVPQAADLDDWAVILVAAGETAGALFLADVAALRSGFAAPAPASPGTWTIDILFAEVDALGRAFRPADAAVAAPPVSGRPDEIGGIGPARPTPTLPTDLVADTAFLRAFLSDPEFRSGDEDRVALILEGIAEAGRRLAPIDYRMSRDAPLAELAFRIGLASLVHLVATIQDIATAPLGSVRFLHRVARLDHAGLGPYFLGVGRTARNSADIFQIAQRAVDAADGRASLDGWIALLVRGINWHMLAEVIDDLGDANRSVALGLLLQQLPVRTDDPHLHLVRRVRDAGLDSGDAALAERAQAIVAASSPGVYHELIILGAIQATGGNFAAAEWTFRECYAMRPDDADCAARLYAARHDDAGGFTVTQGFDTSPDRQEARLRRRGLLHSNPSSRGERIRAVDV